MEIARRLLAEAAAAKQVRAYWETVASILSEQAGGAGVELVYAGVNEASTVVAGPSPGQSRIVEYFTALLGRPPDKSGGVAVWWNVNGS